MTVAIEKEFCCEAHGSDAAGRPSDKLHLRDPANAENTRCRRLVRGGTFVPIEVWGAPDRTWCVECAIAAGLSPTKKRGKPGPKPGFKHKPRVPAHPDAR